MLTNLFVWSSTLHDKKIDQYFAESNRAGTYFVNILEIFLENWNSRFIIHRKNTQLRRYNVAIVIIHIIRRRSKQTSVCWVNEITLDAV